MRRRRQMQAVQRRRDPSYQATHDEMHSTRGRAHLLWEMLQGDLVTDGWRSTEYVTRSTCACPARAAFRTVRSTSTWRLTSPVHPPPLRRPAVGRAAVALVDGLAAAVVANRVQGTASGQPDGRYGAGETPRRNRAPAGHPRVRRPDVHLVVRRAPDADKPRAPRCGSAVAGQLHQLPCAASRPRRRQGVGSRRLRGDASGRSGLLRADLDLHRPAAGSQATHQSFVGGAGATAGHGHPDHRTGTELHRRAAPGRVGLLHDDARAAALATSTVTFAEFLTRTDWQPPTSAPTPWCRRTTSTPCSASTPTVR